MKRHRQWPAPTDCGAVALRSRRRCCKGGKASHRHARLYQWANNEATAPGGLGCRCGRVAGGELGVGSDNRLVDGSVGANQGSNPRGLLRVCEGSASLAFSRWYDQIVLLPAFWCPLGHYVGLVKEAALLKSAVMLGL